MKVRDVLTVDVEDVVLGGKALTRVDGKVVFVDRGLTGDRITARVTKTNKRSAEARLVSLEVPSPQRVAARCAHVARCGGCRLQELPYEQQLRAQGAPGARDAAAPGRVRRAAGARHRRGALRVALPQQDGVLLHARRARATARAGCSACTSAARSTACSSCASAGCRAAHGGDRAPHAAFAREHRWRAYHPSRHDGVARFLVVRHLAHTGECAVHLIAASDELPGLSDWARGVAALSGDVRSVTLGLNRSARQRGVRRGGARAGRRRRHRRAAARARVRGRRNAFLQTNSAQAEPLYTAAIDAARLHRRRTRARPLLRHRHADAAVRARRARGGGRRERARMRSSARGATPRAMAAPTRASSCGESRAVLREWARGERAGAPKPDVVVVDPPRAGLHPRVVVRVAELAPAPHRVRVVQSRHAGARSQGLRRARLRSLPRSRRSTCSRTRRTSSA